MKLLSRLLGVARVLPLILFSVNASAEELGKRPMHFHLKFDGDISEPSWFPENDSVMGGVSKGRAVLREGVLQFTGALSFENNGGFAQVRIRNLGLDLSGRQGMKLRVLGDGRTYQLRLATNARHRGSRIAYRVQFPTTADQWTEVDLRFADLIPTHRGTTLFGPPADLSQVEELGFLIADGREGPFSLYVDWLKAE